MSGVPVISVRNVSKSYNIYRKPTDILIETLFGGVRHDTFWALRDITINVYEKERVGIIGPNGAGKSTLLQLIAGTLQPTTGTVDVNGKISPLLSLTPCWNLEETGLENIRFNLLVQGANTHQIPQMIENIIEFTELGAFIYQPVKSYSSGMSARLAFAIATAIDPEILIVDEVLGAGDGYFAGKAARRMIEMCQRGKALLLVSHSTSAIRLMCGTCIWIDNGSIRTHGPTDSVLRQYEEDVLRQSEEVNHEGNKRRIEARIAMIAPEDVVEDDLCRFRIRPEHSPQLTTSHYIKAITLTIDGVEYPVSLGHEDLRRPDVAVTLDLMSCEWGRIFHRKAHQCRLLQARTGARKGGHIILKRPPDLAGEVPVRLQFDVATDVGSELLTADILDVEAAEWCLLKSVERTKLADGWVRTEAIGHLQIPADRKMAVRKLREQVAMQFQKPVEIERVCLLVDDVEGMSVPELKPFILRVYLRHHEPVPSVSVNINITRSDGAYVFYQPSGLQGRNIENFAGRSIVNFTFDPNPLGFGDYEVNVFATNGFSWDNCPPSEIFDRAIGTCTFKVYLARPISFGLINCIVPVDIELKPDGRDAARAFG
jgi:lipopolysaccharide transport system ATP-binding protein